MLSWLLSNPLPVGATAPDFTLLDQDGQSVTLAQLRGKNVVLVFYPADDTGVCTKQLCEFRDAWAFAKQNNAVVFGVSPQGVESKAKFRKKHDFPFPLLSDPKQRVGELYHTRGLMPKRTVYLIGPDGLIRYARRGKPEPAEVLAACA
jgi:thioredoxin-dependent peroxiredoxin